MTSSTKSSFYDLLKTFYQPILTSNGKKGSVTVSPSRNLLRANRNETLASKEASARLKRSIASNVKVRNNSVRLHVEDKGKAIGCGGSALDRNPSCAEHNLSWYGPLSRGRESLRTAVWHVRSYTLCHGKFLQHGNFAGRTRRLD